MAHPVKSPRLDLPQQQINEITLSPQPLIGPYQRIVVLDTLEKRQKWNTIIKTMTNHPEWYGQVGGRIRGITHVLSFAWVNSSVSYKMFCDRINPEVALVVRSPSTTLDVLYQKSSDMTALMHELYGFVPYSCIFPEPPYTHTLILPLGLQKTPGGHGFKEPPIPYVTATVCKNDQYWYKDQPGAIFGILPRLLSAIKSRHPAMAYITRFDQRNMPTNIHQWPGSLISTWESQFPPGHFRLGWLSYKRTVFGKANKDKIDEIYKELRSLKRERYRKEGDTYE